VLTIVMIWSINDFRNHELSIGSPVSGLLPHLTYRRQFLSQGKETSHFYVFNVLWLLTLCFPVAVFER